MSLVNQMLRDLDKNPKQNTPVALQAVAEAKRGPLGWFLAIAPVFLLVIAYLVFFKDSNNLDEAKIVQPISGIDGTNIIQTSSLTQTVESNTPLANPTATKEVSLINPPTKDRDVESSANISTSITTAASTTFQADKPKPDDVSQNRFSKPAQQRPSAIKSKIEQSLVADSQSTRSAKHEIASKDNEPITGTKTHSKIKQQSLQTQLKLALNQIKEEHNLYGLGHSQEALFELLRKQPDFHNARLYLITISWRGVAETTKKILSDAVEAFPQVSAFRLAAARYYFEHDELNLAEEYLARLDKSQASYYELLQMRALIRQKLDKHQQAINDYSQIIQSAPTRGDIYLAIGISFDALGYQSRAKSSFQNALSDRRLSHRQQQFAQNKINSYQG